MVDGEATLGSSSGEAAAKLPPEDMTVALVAAETSETRGLFGPGSPEENNPSPRGKREGVSVGATANAEGPSDDWEEGAAGDFKAEALAWASRRSS